MINQFQMLIVISNFQSLMFAVAALFFQNCNYSREIIREILISEEILLDNVCIYLQTFYTEQMLANNRSVWMRKRSYEWWDVIVPEFEESDWIENFRMSKETFEYICSKLEGVLQPKFNPLMPRVPLSTRKQVAVAIFTFGSCGEFRVIGHLFGIHKSTVWKCIHRVTEAINEILLPEWIRMPNKTECKKISDGFKKRTGMPRFIGALDGSHIPITPPSQGYRDFINRKGYASYVLQGLVDHQSRFLNINIESPGCNHDANVFKQSGLFKYHRELFCQEIEVINGVEVPFLIMGDPAYPLLPWLIKGFTKHTALTALEESFNAYLNSGRVVVEIAFGRLKGRWRRISKRIDCHHSFVPNIVSACCVLHNIVETQNDAYHKNWDERVKNDRKLFPEPPHEDITEVEEAAFASLNAKRVRCALVNIIDKLPRRKILH